jgi:threonine synthase
LNQARQYLPDLIVTDLMMPELDGFSLVAQLRDDPRTHDIPIIVVSAKDITPDERKRLDGHIEALFQKGSMQPRKFVDQMIRVIEEKGNEKPNP